MTTVRFKFRPSVVDGKPGTVYYRISRKHQSKVFASNIRVESYYWSGNHPISAWLQARIKSDILCLKQIINLRTKENPDFCLDEIVDSFRHQNTHRGLLFFMNECISHLYSERRYGTARNYKSTFRSLAKFTGGCDVAFGSIDEGWLLRYQSWLKARQVSANTISFYMRCLKTVYNKAVDVGKAVGGNIFKNVYVGTETTRKRAVSADVIKRLQSLDLSDDRNLEFARDIFMFSLLTRGMAFVDMAYLKKDNIRDNVLFYHRKKTSQSIRVVLNAPAMEIVNKYKSMNTCMLLPIIMSDDDRSAYLEYRKGIDRYNKNLHKLGKMIGMDGHLTSYVARHSWATMAHRKKISVSVISAALGHTSEKTTRIYLAEIDDNEIDAANRIVTDEIY